MQESRGSSSPLAVLAILGGIAAAVGVFLSWGEITGASFSGSILGQEIPAESMSAEDLAQFGEFVDLSFNGMASTWGIVLLVAGVVAAVGGVMVMVGQRLGRWVAAGGGVVAAVAAVLAFLQRGSVGVDVFFDKIEEAASAAPEAAAVFGGADLQAAFDLIRDFIEVETSIGIGFWICVAGAVLALIGGLMTLTGGGAPTVAPATGYAAPGGGFVTPPAAPPPAAAEPMGEAPPAPPAAPEPPSAPQPPPAQG